MMSDISIKVENLSKQYRLGTVGTGTISHDLNRWWAQIRGKEDPFLKVGEANDRSKAGNSDYVWSLKDINFEVRQGEVLGIIGKNGAGKSTLLKILSKVTGPTTGRIMAKGRIGALLEVGTGFHPELTGRENIFLNGAILGMTKAEIKSKLEEIVEFSGCARYVDTPVKRYSSGMKVRLAFAVAAFLEPEILIVDEVLAVGDAEFQKKAIGKMQDVSKAQGRTVLFVSHNMQAISALCNRLIVLENGQIIHNGDVDNGIEKYLATEKFDVLSRRLYSNETDSPWARLESVEFLTVDRQIAKSIDINAFYKLKVEYTIKETNSGLLSFVNVHFFDKNQNYYFVDNVEKEDAVKAAGKYSTEFEVPGWLFNEGVYSVGVAITGYPGQNAYFFLNPALTFAVTEKDISKRKTPYTRAIPGISRISLNSETKKL